MAMPAIPQQMMSAGINALGGSVRIHRAEEPRDVVPDTVAKFRLSASGQIGNKASDEFSEEFAEAFSEELGDDTIDELTSSDRSRCVHSAMRILAGREHSAVELKRKLLSRGFDNLLIETTLAQLKEDGLQSDERFVESFVRSRVNRGQGPVRIRMELLERGIADSMTAPHLDMGSSYWLKIAREVRERRFGDIPERSDQSWNRQARFLSQRGFPSDVVVRALGA